MRKTYLLLFLLLFSLSMTAQENSQLKFKPINEKCVSVSAQNEDVGGDILVPSTVLIDGIQYTVSAIADEGFKSTKITSITLPPTMEVIGSGAFFRCLSLKSIVLPPSVKDIGYDAFYYCSNLEYIQVIKSNPNYRNVGKAVVDKSDVIVAYPGKGDEKLIIPDGIKGIGSSAFSGCESLREVFIPASVESVGQKAFLFCVNLQRMHWNALESTVPVSCFHGCSSLEEVVLSQNVNNIKGMAFYGTSLRNITILNGTPFPFVTGNDMDTFEKSVFANATVYVPEGSLDLYRSAEGWSQFSRMEEILEGGWRRSLIVSTLDGGTLEYLLDKHTKVRIQQPNLVIETDGAVLTYELDNLSQIRYGRKYITTGVHGEAIVNGQSFRMEDGVLFFDNLRDNSLVEIYTIDGKAVMSRRCGGHAQVTLNQFSPGVYFVKVNGETYKILKK